MKKNPVLHLLWILVLMMSSCEDKAPPTSDVMEFNLDAGWQYRKAGAADWHAATVPGCVHTDLLKDEVIADPFYRLNEKDQQWIGETDWEYKTTFEVSPTHLQRQNIDLVFEGLDTYADVYLNEKKILSADNMFRTWEVDAKAALIAGKNELRIYFHNVFKVNQPQYDSADFRLQAFPNNDQADVKLNLYSRKAGFHYGWDWGPRLVTTGIWRPVTLKSWDDIKVAGVYYRQHKVTAEKAEISGEFEIEATQSTSVELTIKHEGNTLATQAFDVKPGTNKVQVPITIENPKLWWTNGLGEQPLYTFQAMVAAANGTKDVISKRIGIRSLEVIRDDDAFGKSLYVKLNGVPVFMKGANYIPQDNFQSRVTRDRYEHILGSAKSANMNMIRVWGGGIYEEDVFYDLCDEKGLLVWQDIMFACGMYPADDNFLENVKHEVIDNVTRLRNHPSVAMYCGNNENEISWYSWGWKDLYDEAIQKRYEKDLKSLFYETIPNAIAVADPDRYYHPSSPIADIGKDRPKGDGDSHYWGVWHGKEPFENFDKNVSRFVSEYGFQSYPEFASIKKFSEKEDWFLESDVMHSHQRSMADDRKDLDYGNRLINTYLERNFNTPKNFENYIYAVQALQAKGVKMAVESHRRNRTDNYCMGTMYWQIDDCWPVASWSSIDYYGKWKALHYIVKQAYAQVLATYREEHGKLGIHIVSDELQPIGDAALTVEVLDFNGNMLWSKQQPVSIDANTSKEYFSLNLKEALDTQNRGDVYVKTSIKKGNELLSENRYFFVNEKELSLPHADIHVSATKVASGYELTLNSESFAKYVMVSTEIEDGFLTDNYFDLDAGIPKVITLETEATVDNILENLSIMSLTDSYERSSAIASIDE